MTRDIETKSKGSNESGATVVEFAFIVTLLLVITFGILEFAFIFSQRHFIGNAAREGLRVGIRADNYETFDVDPGCADKLDRFCAVEVAVNEYLEAFYRPENIYPLDVVRVGDSLKVTVKVDNFFPPLLSGFIPGYVFPATLSYSAIGIYEDPDEL